MKITSRKIVALVCMLLGMNITYGHGSEEPKHGGVVQIAHEMVFELVRGNDSVSLFIEDHGKPVDTDAFTGTVTILAKGEKNDVALTHQQNNQMTAAVQIPDGAKVLVKVAANDHHPVTLRYSF